LASEPEEILLCYCGYKIYREGFCHVRGVSGKSITSKICQGNLVLFAMSVTCKRNLTLLADTKHGATYLNHHFASLCHNELCEIYMAEDQRSTIV